MNSTHVAVLTDWTTDMLDDGCFTFGSDVYQIGVMMDKLLKSRSQDILSDAIGPPQMLRNKISANEALQHAWLQT